MTVVYTVVGGALVAVAFLLLRVLLKTKASSSKWYRVKRLALTAAIEFLVLLGGYSLILASGKRVWSWLELLIVPAVLALGAWWLQKSERETEREIADKQRRQSTLESYFDWVGRLLINEVRQEMSEEDGIDPWLSMIIRARTLAALRALEATGRRQILEFLYDTGLISVSVTIPIGKYHAFEGIHHRERASEFSEDAPALDLSGALLAGVDLSGSLLDGIWLTEAILRDADFRGASLKGANLSLADLTRANMTNMQIAMGGLQEANLRSADLSRSDLRLADLTGADLCNSTLTSARLTAANLRECRLLDVEFRQVDLSAATLVDAELRGADLRYLTLLGTDFESSDLRRADFTSARPVKAKFRYADLRDAILSHAALRGADFEGADLRGADLRKADLSPHMRSPAREEVPQRTSLRHANLSGALLDGADLTGVDLTGANVTSSQLKAAKSLVGSIRSGATSQAEYTLTTDQLRATYSPPYYYAFLGRILDEDPHSLDGHPVAGSRSPGSHVYLMEDGRKRWIKDIPTLEALGFRWKDVVVVDAESLRQMPDGPTIPKQAGSPPQPRIYGRRTAADREGTS